jgi:hypothetical protein
MKRLFLVLALLFSASLLAQAPEPMPLAHGNTPGEPHHHLKIENAYARVYYVEVPPHENTQLHQHDHDYLFITLGDSDVINAVRDKPEVHLVLKDGETHFTRGGFAHVARNLADAPFRNITIELLKPQGEAHNLCAQVLPNAPVTNCPEFLKGQSGPKFYTAECTVDVLLIEPGITYALEANEFAFLGVVVDSKIRVWPKGKVPTYLQEGEMAWFEPKPDVLLTNHGSKAAQFLKVSFKDSGSHARP